MNKSTSRILSLFNAALVLLVPSMHARASDSVTVPPSTWVQVTGPDGVCYQIYNNNGSNSMYVADVSVAEWQNFYNHPNNATLAACGCVGGDCVGGDSGGGSGDSGGGFGG